MAQRGTTSYVTLGARLRPLGKKVAPKARSKASATQPSGPWRLRQQQEQEQEQGTSKIAAPSTHKPAFCLYTRYRQTQGPVMLFDPTTTQWLWCTRLEGFADDFQRISNGFPRFQ